MVDKTDITAGIKYFLQDAVRFEKKKLILPCLAVLIILSAVTLTGYLKYQGVDERSANASLYSMTEQQVIFVEHAHFNESISGTARQRSDEIDKRAEEMNPIDKPYLSTSNSLVVADAALLGVIYYTPFFPVAPGGTMLGSLMGSYPDKAVFFPSEEGYYLSKDIPETLTLVRYRTAAITALNQEVDETDMTHQEFRQRVDEVKSHGPQHEALRDRYEYPIDEESIQAESSDSPSASSFLGERNIEREIRQARIMGQTAHGEIKEIGLVHFMPAIAVAFIWNYLLGGFVIATLRSMKKFVLRLSNGSKDSRENKQVNQQRRTQGNRQYNNQQQRPQNNRQYNNQQGQNRNNPQNNRRRD